MVVPSPGTVKFHEVPSTALLCRVFASSEILTLIYDTNIQMCGEITDSTDKRSPAVRSRDQYW